MNKPLGEKALPEKPEQGEWQPYGPNPMMEINRKGQLRTKPGSEHGLPPPSKNPWDVPYTY